MSTQQERDRPAGGVSGPEPRHADSMMLVRVYGDRIEVTEQLSDDRTAKFVAQLRRLGLHGTVTFNTPCG